MRNESLAERLNGKFVRIFFVAIFFYVVASGFAPMLNQVDLGWQVAQGRWIVQHFAAYRQDVFNYPNLGRPVINEYPFFEIVLYAAWALGWWGPCLLCAVAYAVLVVVWVRAARQFGLAESSLMAAAIGLALLFFLVAFPLRPHLVTYLCVTILGVFLLRHRATESWKIFWPMVLLQVLWTNSHSAFVLGPIMVGLFGAETVVRRWLSERKFPRAAVFAWAGGFVLISLACLINPHGWMRFQPVFLQAGLESVRAYVGEMEPLGGGLATIYGLLTLVAVLVVVAGLVLRGGAIAVSFVVIALALYLQAQLVMKAWPIFGLYVPLIVLSSGALSARAGKPASWLGMFASFVFTVLGVMALLARLVPSFDSSLYRQWHEYDAGRSELPLEATAWLQTQDIPGRLFHRCEDGGWLQMNGYDHGETYADTGFGKYDADFIHEIGLVNERPALVPHFIDAYNPRLIVCNNFCYQWPYYLQQKGWHLLFYSPNSSVWGSPDRLDLLSPSAHDIMATFDHDLAANGIPSDVRLLGRNIIALNSMGLEDFAFAKLTGLPQNFHHADWYWEAARIMCFQVPKLSSIDCDALEHEAESLGDATVTADFRAHYRYSFGDVADATRILESVPTSGLSNSEAELLLKIYIDHPDPGSLFNAKALPLALRTDCFDLRNGRHWLYLAEAYGETGNMTASTAAYRKALFYYPDVFEVVSLAEMDASTMKDQSLLDEVRAVRAKYGTLAPQ